MTAAALKLIAAPPHTLVPAPEDGEPPDDVTAVQRLMVAELIGRRVETVVLRGARTLRLEIVPAQLDDGRER